MSAGKFVIVEKELFKELETKINSWVLGRDKQYWQIFRHPKDNRALIARRGLKGKYNIIIKEIRDENEK